MTNRWKYENVKWMNLNIFGGILNNSESKSGKKMTKIPFLFDLIHFVDLNPDFRLEVDLQEEFWSIFWLYEAKLSDLLPKLLKLLHYEAKLFYDFRDWANTKGIIRY